METLHILKPFSFLIDGHHRIYQPNLSVKWRCEEPVVNVWLCGWSRYLYTWQCYWSRVLRFPGDSIVGFCDSTHEFDIL